MEETTMGSIIGRIAATLAVAATLGVGCVLTAKAIPLVGAVNTDTPVLLDAGFVSGAGSPILNEGGVPQISPANTFVGLQALASGNVDEVLVTSDVGSRVDHRMLYASWVPLADPAGGPNFFPLDEDARYYADHPNDQGLEDISVPIALDGATRAGNPGGALAFIDFLAETGGEDSSQMMSQTAYTSSFVAVPPVNSVSDPNLNLIQTYDLV
jgi:hypothetical protein